MNAQKPGEILRQWGQQIEAAAEPYRSFTRRYLWTISGPDGGSWIMKPTDNPAVRSIPLEEISCQHGKNQCRIELSGETLERIASGQLNPQTALVQGILNITGPVEDIFELNFILDRLIFDYSAGADGSAL